MQALHRDDDRATGLIVEPGKGTADQFVNAFALDVRKGVGGIKRVVENQIMRTTAGQASTKRCCQPKAALCC